VEAVMTEVLFILTVIFVAYVLCVVVNDKKVVVKSPEAKPEKQVEIAVSPSSIKPVPQKERPPEIIKSPSIEKSISTKQTHKKGLKDPKTGDIATTYSNYRFSKRWIKEALVTEGLLEKVYKNNELNAEIEASIKAAIAKLEAMDEYKV
jgi:hypothetical protein